MRSSVTKRHFQSLSSVFSWHHLIDTVDHSFLSETLCSLDFCAAMLFWYSSQLFVFCGPVLVFCSSQSVLPPGPSWLFPWLHKMENRCWRHCSSLLATSVALLIAKSMYTAVYHSWLSLGAAWWYGTPSWMLQYSICSLYSVCCISNEWVGK